MTSRFTSREALVLGASAAALAASGARAQPPASKVKAADVPAPSLPIEKGASLRMLRPVRFVQADEDVFRANAAKVAPNTGAGPDIIIGFGDAPHIYVDKVLELTDVADYIGKRYGGWLFLAEKYGPRFNTIHWVGLAVRAAGGPAGGPQW